MDVSEIEKHILLNVFSAAQKLMNWTADDWDDEARQDFYKLKAAVDEADHFVKLKHETVRAARAASYPAPTCKCKFFPTGALNTADCDLHGGLLAGKPISENK